MEVQLIPDGSLLRIAEYDIERRKRFVSLDSADIDRIAVVRDTVIEHIDEHAAAFFDFLSKLPEAEGLFSNRAILEEAKRLKRDHLVAMVAGEYGKAYVEQRLKLGLLYSKAGLDSRVFLGAFNAMLRSIGSVITKRFGKDPKKGFEHFEAIRKIGFFDLGVIVDVLIADRESTITAQQQAIKELSTPVLQVRDRLLILPIIGLLDSHRAKQLTDGLLRAIRANRAKMVVMDVTGVATVDTKVANHLIQTVAASRLMGATVIVTGLSADVAQSLVILGIDLSKLNAVGDLQGGVEEAERLLGYEVVRLSGNGHRASS